MTDEPTDPDRLAEVISEAEKLGAKILGDGDIDGARKVFGELLGLMPKNPIGLFGMGIVAQHEGDAAKAEHLYRDASRYAPEWAQPFAELGRIQLSQGRVNRAERNLAKAISLDPDNLEARYALATAAQINSKTAVFEQHLREIRARAPEHAPAANDLGCLCAARGDFQEAEALLRTAMESQDPPPSAAANLGNVMLLQNRLAEASDVFEQALAAMPSNIDVLVGAATMDRRSGNLEKALLRAEQALSLAPEHNGAANLVGVIYRELGQYEAAAEQFEAVLSRTPNDGPSRANFGMLQLLQGDWHNGWKNYEARRTVPDYRIPWGGVTAPAWDGGDLSGKRMIVLSEQGFGDSIQFARFLPALIDRGAEVHFAVQPELRPLLSTMDERLGMISPDTEVSAFDLQVLLLSIAGQMGVDDIAAIDGKPYLTAQPASGALKDSIAALSGFKVGINWRGSTGHKEDFKRSMNAAALSPLLSKNDVTFVNLNFGEASELPDGLIDMSAHIADFSDSASLIDALDLVISVDTATVHLAGALGKTCWAMLPFVPDWRWQLSGETTPWYDSVKLYRQPERGNWDGVLEQVAVDLETRSD